MKNKPVLTKTFPRDSDNFHSFPRGSTQHTLHLGGSLHPPWSGGSADTQQAPIPNGYQVGWNLS